MFKVNNKDTSVFIVNFEHISHLVLVFLLLTLNIYTNANKDSEKVNKDTKKANTLDLYDNTIVKTSCVHKTDTKMLKIQDIDINKIKVSKKKLYSK